MTSATEEYIMQDQAARPAPIGPAASGHHLPSANDFLSSSNPQYASSYDAQYRAPNAGRAEQLAKALGWFSIGLGLAQLLAPRQVSRAIGVAESPTLMRAIGARELTAGVGILSQRRPANWLWSRVAGDAMDLAMLGAAARSPGTQRRRLAIAGAAVAGIAALDLLSSMDNQQRKLMGQGPTISGAVNVEKSVTINKSPEECYRFWHDFEAFPRFMKHIESVQLTGENRMHWKATGPLGMTVEWDAELTEDQPGRLLAWRSVEGADVDNAGSVRFESAPGGRGTIVRVVMQYSPPAGVAGALIAGMFGEEPSQQIDEDLRRFKWLIETGEIPTTVGQPSGPRGAWNRTLFRKGTPG
ncbi:SRPBCC family protein [Herbaspirillum sp. GCM10030257]|uniref:SRPBCC family protein n=1 Tax=Herbaspirillum sp. GCM10030257 TaxID=3273393 RepID=UPI00361FC539